MIDVNSKCCQNYSALRDVKYKLYLLKIFSMRTMSINLSVFASHMIAVIV